VADERLEQARAVMLELFPDGFEEIERGGSTELVAYTDPAGEERLWHAFGGASATDVETGWEDRWRDFHRPVRVGPLWVGPPWEQPPRGALAVVIDPGRAFGTGGHATTRLCLELLLDLPHGSILDVGSGSGVLSIAAALLGFAPVLALDVAEAAVAATGANAAANHVDVQVQQGDALTADLPVVDVALVNIAPDAVAEIGPRLRARLVVTSGYLAADAPELAGYRRVERRERDGWAADLHERV
jgi:ribosomal protein L11 methyltransferase